MEEMGIDINDFPHNWSDTLLNVLEEEYRIETELVNIINKRGLK